MRQYDTDVNDPAFNAWCDLLDAHAASIGILVQESHTKDTGRECWIGYYEDDLSPEQAFNEDMSLA